jgi:CRP-like cAMP-binding protein
MSVISSAVSIACRSRGALLPPLGRQAVSHRRHVPHDGPVLLKGRGMHIPNQLERFGMGGGSSQPSNAILSRMASFARLSSEDVMLLGDMPPLARREAGQGLHGVEAEGYRPQLLTEGWACHQRVLSDGRRQIFDFILPGDGVGVSTFSRGAAIEAVALTPVQAVDAGLLMKAVHERSPAASGLAEAVGQMGCRDRARLHNQVLRFGLPTAYERLVHLMLEFHSRLDVIGLVRDGSFALPVTQEAWADAVGISPVHMNRTLQQVRKDGLLELRSGRMTLHKIEAMQSLCDDCLPCPC